MTREELLKLADRCEQADGPDREIDHGIVSAVKAGMRHPWFVTKPEFTRSIDAAMQLVPEGVGLHFDRYWIASVEDAVWSAHITTGGVPENPRRVFEVFDCMSAALALCSAALRAIADMKEG